MIMNNENNTDVVVVAVAVDVVAEVDE